LPTGEGSNPLVLATFEGSIDAKPKPRILFYGYVFFGMLSLFFMNDTYLFRRHYDVVAAPPDGWISPPFSLKGRNGYLYGRGITDDKGPIIAVACAAADLLSQRALEVDLVFLVEGEAECGSVGFKDAVQKHKVGICL
jgi:di- and tripeptidase